MSKEKGAQMQHNTSDQVERVSHADNMDNLVPINPLAAKSLGIPDALPYLSKQAGAAQDAETQAQTLISEVLQLVHRIETLSSNSGEAYHAAPMKLQKVHEISRAILARLEERR